MQPKEPVFLSKKYLDDFGKPIKFESLKPSPEHFFTISYPEDMVFSCETKLFALKPSTTSEYFGYKQLQELGKMNCSRRK